MRYLKISKEELKRKAQITGYKAIVKTSAVASGIKSFIVRVTIGGVLFIVMWTGFFNATASMVPQVQDPKDKAIKTLTAALKDMEERTKTDRGAPIQKPELSEVNKEIIALNQDIITASKLNKFLKGMLENKGLTIYKTATKYKIDPFLVAAICRHESTNGTSQMIKSHNNPGGLLQNNSKPIYFKSIDSALEFMCSLLKNHYIDQGLTSIKQIQGKYCPVGATNDPNGLNKYWLTSVTKFYNEMKGAN